MSDAGESSARIVIENNSDRPRIVWIEPWGEDYTLLPKEKLEVLAQAGTGTPWFHVVEYNEGCQVYMEGQIVSYMITQGSLHLRCGHRRQVAIDAGLKL